MIKRIIVFIYDLIGTLLLASIIFIAFYVVFRQCIEDKKDDVGTEQESAVSYIFEKGVKN
ncbi:MAG: hypothetical protein KKH98_07990 [Spirochaetes bacterium]|nr:hypothetical protein [Spirochaetota bacterium]